MRRGRPDSLLTVVAVLLLLAVAGCAMERPVRPTSIASGAVGGDGRRFYWLDEISVGTYHNQPAAVPTPSLRVLLTTANTEKGPSTD